MFVNVVYLLFDVICGAFHGSLSFGQAGLFISKMRGDVPVVFNVQGWIVKLIGVILMKFVQS